VLAQDASRDMIAACEHPAACAQLVARLELEFLGDLPQSEELTDECAERFAQQLVLRRLYRTRSAQPVHASGSRATPGELRARARFRQHRVEARLLFAEVKCRLWMAVLRGALLEAGALLVRLEAECTTKERHELLRRLEESRGTHGSADLSGEELAATAEQVATQRLLEGLQGMHRLDQAPAEPTPGCFVAVEAPPA